MSIALVRSKMGTWKDYMAKGKETICSRSTKIPQDPSSSSEGKYCPHKTTRSGVQDDTHHVSSPTCVTVCPSLLADMKGEC